jgi:hypothetical protein
MANVSRYKGHQDVLRECEGERELIYLATNANADAEDFTSSMPTMISTTQTPKQGVESAGSCTYWASLCSLYVLQRDMLKVGIDGHA